MATAVRIEHAQANRGRALLGARVMLRCATCGVPVASYPEYDDGEAFCCAGCGAGGPCTCTYDSAMDGSQGAAPGGPHVAARWPIDQRLMHELLTRAERMARETRSGYDADRLRRLGTLRRHCSAVSVMFDPDVAAIGRRVTIGGEDGHLESFWLALPGDEEATANTISIAAPAGQSLAGARVGDVVYVETGGRRRWAVVLGVA